MTVSLEGRGMLSDNCVRGALIHASECWALRREDILRLLEMNRPCCVGCVRSKLRMMYGQFFFSVSDERPDLAIQDL